ncbi:MAG: 50S ribosomal protein L23 [Candidatus Marinimicrobia bacterium]|jgi:large subunit ribosomal protein L23|nr:50S ribosomal protein L23 [Candidatus Neomarinimicrobiota bacterium]MDP6499828.1 50S ribosomal protein L23 [Candidatus Neomarinimicrobiota bacterium]|tara:strand:- start:72118 stop:72435 length:318 start_codon:yes stop_codon:yes gene_type:complete
MSVREIIIKPLFTEKLSQLEETQRKYAFQVDSSANKIEIKDAVEKRFDVIVAKVATMNRLGKAKQMTVRSGGRTIRTNGHRSNWKKAIITLKEGSTIDLIRGEVG